MSNQPWLRHYPEGVQWEVEIEPRPLHCILDEAAARFPNKVYLDFLGRKFTYAAIASMVDRAAKGFQALGVGKDVKVGLFLSNCPQAVVAFFAILKAGGTVVNYSPLYSKRELLEQIEDSQTDLMVTLAASALYPKMRALLDQSRLQKLVIGTVDEVLPFPKNVLFKIFERHEIAKIDPDERQISFRQLLDNDGAYDPVETDPENDIAVLQYTGGTTGTPKGAMLTHANLYSNIRQVAMWDPGAEPGTERIIGVLPLFHAFAMSGIMLVGAAWGAEVLLYPRFSIDDLLRDIDKKKATFLPAVPTMFTAIINHPDLAKYDLSSLRRCVAGGAPLPAEIREKFEALTGSTITEGYGLTESSPTATIGPVHGLRKEGSIGLPVPDTVITIVDLEDPRKILPIGEVGEICISGPQVMRGYWRRPDATRDAIVDGRLRTGDIGYMDADGYTFIIDRKKDMILVGGFNVFPRNIEEALYLHPAVKEVTVIGVPHDYHGETPKAFVVLKNSDEEIAGEDLRTFLGDHLGRHEIPSEIEFRNELPKTMIGKLSKKELVAEEQAKLSV
ncbi:MAG: long-chain fatty acid--CoA ligase [Sphingomonadales bacterium]